jgi:hypothetical protein
MDSGMLARMVSGRRVGINRIASKSSLGHLGEKNAQAASNI